MYFNVLFGLFAVLVLNSCIALGLGVSPDVELAKKCIEEYKNVLANYNAEKGTCTRLQIFMDCLSKRRGLRSQMLDSMRHFFMQQAIFVHKLNFCPNIDFKDLKEITAESDLAHISLENSKYDESDRCAVDVHKTCVSFYTNLFSKEKKICDDVTSWINCYSKEAEAIGCNAEILKDFAKMLESTGGLVIREIRRHAGSECLKMEL